MRARKSRRGISEDGGALMVDPATKNAKDKIGRLSEEERIKLLCRAYERCGAVRLIGVNESGQRIYEEIRRDLTKDDQAFVNRFIENPDLYPDLHPDLPDDVI
jgi:hypothetical protein